MPTSSDSAELFFDLLHEPLIGWRDTHGEMHQSNLPEVLAALAANQLRDFPGCALTSAILGTPSWCNWPPSPCTTRGKPSPGFRRPIGAKP